MQRWPHLLQIQEKYPMNTIFILQIGQAMAPPLEFIAPMIAQNRRNVNEKGRTIVRRPPARMIFIAFVVRSVYYASASQTPVRCRWFGCANCLLPDPETSAPQTARHYGRYRKTHYRRAAKKECRCADGVW